MNFTVSWEQHKWHMGSRTQLSWNKGVRTHDFERDTVTFHASEKGDGPNGSFDLPWERSSLDLIRHAAIEAEVIFLMNFVHMVWAWRILLLGRYYKGSDHLSWRSHRKAWMSTACPCHYPPHQKMCIDREGVCQKVKDRLAHVNYLPDGWRTRPMHHHFLGVWLHGLNKWF